MEDELLSEEEQKELYPHSDTLGVNERHVDFGKAWDSARTVQDWRNPVDVAAAGTARALEFIVPQSQEEWMLEMTTLGQGKKLNLGRKLAHAAVKDIPVVGDFYAKGTAYMSNKLNNWFSSPRSEGPFPAWQTQDVPQTKLSSEISDLSKKHDVQFSEPSPQPDWVDAAKTGKLADEKIFMQNALADELVFDATGKHISKRKEDAYKFLGKFRAEWNRWSKDNKYIQEFADKPSTAYVEHLVGKDKYYDPFWALPNEKRFRKGSRHGPHNVRILYNNRMKSFKDASETILKKIHKPKDPMDFILLDYEIPILEPGSIAVQQSPGNLLVKRVDGTVIGELGDYHDILYASNSEKIMGKYETLSYKLGSHINPRTGKPYIRLTKEITDKNGKKVTVKLSKDEINQQITNWREKILKDKLQLIIDEEKTLKGMDEATKFQYQGSAIQEDMVEFLDEYSFIKPTKGFSHTMKKDPINSPRGGEPILTQKDKREGIFLTKSDELELHKAYLHKGSISKQLRDRIKGNEELLDNIIEPDE